MMKKLEQTHGPTIKSIEIQHYHETFQLKEQRERKKLYRYDHGGESSYPVYFSHPKPQLSVLPPQLS
jgi:hypothetical protein